MTNDAATTVRCPECGATRDVLVNLAVHCEADGTLMEPTEQGWGWSDAPL